MPETRMDKPLNELLSRSMVDIYVGPENTHWVLHEKLICHHSPIFRKIFYSKAATSKTYGLPEEEDLTFKTFVGWLYSSSLPIPREENDIALQLDLYLFAERFEIASLVQDVLQVTREWYKFSDTYPGLRRVQYVYANTEEGSPMRNMLVHAVARMLVLGDGIPKHWDKALKKNGQLAVDIIRAVQEWRLEEELVPDAREEPEQAEELVGEEEVEEAVTKDHEDVQGDVPGEALDQEPEHSREANELKDDAEDAKAGAREEENDALDSSEDTVVESPHEESTPKSDLKKPSKGQKDVAKRSSKLQKKAGNLTKDLGEVPNTVALEDYGTLGAH